VSRPRPALRAAAAVCGLLAATASARLAEARSAALVPYPVADVWPAAIRFLRVDHDYPIKEKDEGAGYVLFEISEGKRSYRAALELVKASDGDGRNATQLVLSVQELPRHYEVALLEKMSAKVRDERGPPAPPPARKPAPGNGEPAPAPPKEGSKPAGDLDSLPRPPTWGPGEGK